MREKLIELIRSFNSKIVPYYAEEIADLLIANGVMMKSNCEDCASKTTRIIDKLHGENAKLREIQRWIPVTERLPDENGYYLCVVCVSSVNQRKEYRRMILFWEDNVWIDMTNCFRTKKPLYWMPLPEPPKGE